jgi:hypothetical protein
MRIRGRTLRPSTIAERRLLMTFGVDYIRVPRGTNPYVVARRFARAARHQTPDHLFVRDVIDRSRSWPAPKPSPEPDNSGVPSEEAVTRVAS